MIDFRYERMSGEFEKWHIVGLPGVNASINHFTGPDKGDPHDHPFHARIFIISGGYYEKVFFRDGTFSLMHRTPGDNFHINATHIHQIVKLPTGESWSLMTHGDHERVTRFWRFEDGVAYSRAWNEVEWVKEKGPG